MPIAPDRVLWAQFPSSLHVSWDEFETALVQFLGQGPLAVADRQLLKYVLGKKSSLAIYTLFQRSNLSFYRLF